MSDIILHINHLKKLTAKKDIDSIYSYLNKDIYSSTKEKGDVLEHFMKFLYERLGYQVVLNGGAGDKGADLFLYLDTTGIPVKAIQIKNHKKAQNIDNIYNDAGKFIRGYDLDEKIFTYFSLNGFVDGTKIKVGGRFFLESFDSLIPLINLEDNPNEKRIFQVMSDLYPHNKYAYDQIKNHLKNHDKAAIVQPTGSGKMKIILQLLADNALNKEKTLVLAPTKVILQEIKEGLPWSVNYTKFMTYSKAASLSQEYIEKNLNIKYILLDELHRFGAEKWGEGVQNIIEYSHSVKVAGFTATPNRMDGKNIIEDFFDGDLVSNLSFEDAIVRGILPFPKYISAMYTLEEEVAILKEKIDNAKLSEEEKAEHREAVRKATVYWEKTSGINSILKKHVPKKIEDPKFIVFCENISMLNDLKPTVKNWFKSIFKNVDIKSVHSYKKKLNDNINWFKEKGNEDTVKILMSVNMLNEGLHVKGITGVVFLRKTASEIIFKQQLGRALSSAERDKTPLVFDFVNNFTLLNSKNFQEKLTESIFRENQIRAELGLKERNIAPCVIDEIQDIREILSGVKTKLGKSFIEELKEFDDTYLEYPKDRGERLNGREAALYKILNRLKKNNFETITDPEELKFLKSYIDKYKRPTLIEEIKEFDNIYLEYPKVKGKRLNGRENALYTTLNRIKKNNFKTITDPEELKFLKSYIDKYKRPTLAEELKEFENIYVEYPKAKGKRLNGREDALYKILNRLKKNNFETITDPEELKFLKEYMQKYKQPTLAEELKEFDNIYLEYPKVKGKRLNGREDALYLYLNRTKKNNFKTITDPEELKFLKSYIQKYKRPTLAEELKEFDNIYVEYPKAKGKRLNGREGALYAALNKLKKNNFETITDPKELKFLKSYIDKYKRPTLAEELKEFDDIYDEFPKVKGKRLNGREGAINSNFNRLKKNNFEKIKDPEELKFLKEYILKYSK